MSTQSLKQELMSTLNMVNEQVLVLNGEAVRRDVSVHKMMDMHGNYMLTPLLVARAQILAALATLEAK